MVSPTRSLLTSNPMATPYQPMAGAKGAFIWCCPSCGTVHQDHQNPGQFVFDCRQCHKLWEVSYVFRERCLKRGHGEKPRDLLMGLAPLKLAVVLPPREYPWSPLHVLEAEL